MKIHFLMLARYNAWANERLFDCVSLLSPADYRADIGLYFRSIEGTLSHLLASDLIWAWRFTGEGGLPRHLDEILYPRFDELRAARRQLDRRIIELAGRMDESGLAEPMAVSRWSQPGQPPVQVPKMLALSHWFNHQTHHRGQAHAGLTALPAKAPILDLMEFHRQGCQAGAAPP